MGAELPRGPRGWHRTLSPPSCPDRWRDAAARLLLPRGRPGDGALRRRLGRHGWESAPALPAVPAGPHPDRALVGGGAGWGPAIGRCAGAPPGVLGVVRGAAAPGPGRRRGVPLRARRDRRGPGTGPHRRAGPIARSARRGRRGRRRRRRLGRSGRDRRGGAPARCDLRRPGVERGARRCPQCGTVGRADHDRGLRRLRLRARARVAPTPAGLLPRSVDGRGGTARSWARTAGRWETAPEPGPSCATPVPATRSTAAPVPRRSGRSARFPSCPARPCSSAAT